jgi:hypothetical protein
MTPDAWKLIASIGGVLITVVTGPLIWALRAEAKAIRLEMKLLHAEISKELTEMEKRLNERIDTRLVHR